MTTPQTTAVVVADAAATTTPEPAIKPSAGPANLLVCVALCSRTLVVLP